VSAWDNCPFVDPSRPFVEPVQLTLIRIFGSVE
jgi:hypothetical protein